MNHIALGAADAVECIEIFEYVIELLDRVAQHARAAAREHEQASTLYAPTSRGSLIASS